MLEPLIEAIETAKKRIDQHRQTLSENETRTRGALIDPILKALGWDPGDPALVTLEYSVGSLRADYALLDHDGEPAAVFEAKRLGAALNDQCHRMQMLNYANTEGIEYAGLTDGDRWELYSVFERAHLNDRRLIDISIVEDEPHMCALELLTLWRLNLASGKVQKVRTPIIFNTENASPPPDRDPTPEPPPEQTPAPPTELPLEGEWEPFPEYLEAYLSPDVPRPLPSAIKFSDESEAPIHRWYDIHVEIAKWLHSKGMLTREQMPAMTENGRTYAANSEPVTHDGKEMASPVEIADGVYVSKHRSASRKMSHAISLLQHCNVDQSDVHLKIGPWE